MIKVNDNKGNLLAIGYPLEFHGQNSINRIYRDCYQKCQLIEIIDQDFCYGRSRQRLSLGLIVKWKRCQCIPFNLFTGKNMISIQFFYACF